MEGFITPLSIMFLCLIHKTPKPHQISFRENFREKLLVLTEFRRFTKLCKSCKFPQNLHTSKLIEITAFYVVVIPRHIERF